MRIPMHYRGDHVNNIRVSQIYRICLPGDVPVHLPQSDARRGAFILDAIGRFIHSTSNSINLEEASWPQRAAAVTAQHPVFIRVNSKLAEGEEEMGASTCMSDGCMTVSLLGHSHGRRMSTPIVAHISAWPAWAAALQGGHRCAACVAASHA